ncbi:unnamed protein product [Mytilus coruscus]|uniref:EGF-like domain-containing protein n=1 Tax=Mytilus coruscus TaxID=42192 RepID=A0A6J8CTX6_MYTCO|nr:unnamed protein product [Mytilus coruscus]
MDGKFIIVYISLYMFLIDFVSVVSNRACGFGRQQCDLSEWLPWGNCTTECGGGIQTRRRKMCCNINTPLEYCLATCNLTMRSFTTITTENQPCGRICSPSGLYNFTTNTCICNSGYYGLCCYGKYPRYTRPSNITAAKSTRKYTTNSHRNRTFITHDRQKNVDAISQCIGFPCLHGTCLHTVSGYLCYCEPGFTGKNCHIDEDDCENDPCSYGTCVDEINGYSCNCNVLFHGKNCSRMKLWAVICICVGTFILLSFGCCCLVCCPCCRRQAKNDKNNQVGQVRRQTEAWKI